MVLICLLSRRQWQPRRSWLLDDYIYIYMYIYIILIAWSFLTLTLTTPTNHLSLLANALDYMLISAQSCHVSSYQKHNTCESICRTPNSSFFPLQQFPERISLLTWMICTMGGKWLYSFCFMGWLFHDFFKTVRSILVQFTSSFF